MSNTLESNDIFFLQAMTANLPCKSRKSFKQLKNKFNDFETERDDLKDEQSFIKSKNIDLNVRSKLTYFNTELVFQRDHPTSFQIPTISLDETPIITRLAKSSRKKRDKDCKKKKEPESDAKLKMNTFNELTQSSSSKTKCKTDRDKEELKKPKPKVLSEATSSQGSKSKKSFLCQILDSHSRDRQDNRDDDDNYDSYDDVNNVNVDDNNDIDADNDKTNLQTPLYTHTQKSDANENSQIQNESENYADIFKRDILETSDNITPSTNFNETNELDEDEISSRTTYSCASSRASSTLSVSLKKKSREDLNKSEPKRLKTEEEASEQLTFRDFLK